MPIDHTRRTLLASLATAAAGGAAGCTGTDGAPAAADEPATTGDDSPAAESTPDATTSVDTSSDSDTDGNSDTDADAATGSAVTTEQPLDLREANVTAVAVDCDGRDCRFDVTLYHDDDGEDGYANWWQVETRDGERLGRRDLLHAHGTREFTRSATITIPEGISEVVVRGHDQTHGYGGQAMLVNLDTGDTTAIRQGSDPSQVD